MILFYDSQLIEFHLYSNRDISDNKFNFLQFKIAYKLW